MKNGFYRKLAWSNVRKNARFFIPRMLAEAGLTGCFYIALTLAMDGRLAKVRGGDYIPTFMWIGVAVLALLSAVIAFYANSFLMKQRKREFGLYNVLGLEKKHVGRVLFWEGFLASAFSVPGGIAWGILFYKLCALLICRLLKTEIVIGFYFITLKTVLPAGAFFLLLDLITGLFNRISVARMNPVELLMSLHSGEREPKVKRFLLLLGVLSLGAGYYIALTTGNPLEAMLLFFVAVVLVMIGTYCLFVSGSIFILKALRRRKNFYYEKRRMPVISGLLYRMKQNAVGLASVAILSTGILIMISTTVSLYAGLEGTLRKNYQQDLYLSAVYGTGENTTECVPVELLEEYVRAAAEETGIAIASVEKNEYLSVAYCLQGNRLLTTAEAEKELSGTAMYDWITNFLFIDADTYETLTGTRLVLNEDEIALCRISSPMSEIGGITGELTVHGEKYRIKETLNLFPIKSSETVMNGFSTYGAVFANADVLEKIYLQQREAYGEHASDMTGRIGVTFENAAEAEAVSEAFQQAVTVPLTEYMEARSPDIRRNYYNFSTIWETRDSLLGLYGTLLFLGMLLGAVSLFATVLILYYKQISEGYEDRERFQIMEKIGMSREEVRKAISFQVLFVFFLPLVTAGVHVAFAYPMLEKMLKVLALYKPSLFLVCTLITFGVFALVYALIYIGTSKTYYKIVE